MATRINKKVPKAQVAESSQYLMEGDISSGVAELEALAKTNIQRKRKAKVYPLRVKVSFRTSKDCARFATAIQRSFKASEKELTFSAPDAAAVGSWSFVYDLPEKKRKVGLSDFHATHWKGMPDFEQEDSQWVFHSLTMVF